DPRLLGGRRDRLPRLLLSLPRHDHGEAVPAGRALDDRHGAAARRRPHLPIIFRRHGRGRDRDPPARRFDLPPHRLAVGRAAHTQRAYAYANPGGWRGYTDRIWGLTASDGPGDLTLTIDGHSRQFHSYWARGASFIENPDDGTIAPTAAGGSIPFAPEIAI